MLRATPYAAGPLFFKILPALASRDCHLGPFRGLGASFLTFWEPFWHLGSTLEGHFGTSEAPWEVILTPRDHLGGPWEQQDGLEVVDNRIWGLFMSVFESQNSSKFLFLLGLSPDRFFYRVLNQKFGVWEFQSVSVSNIVFSWKSFLMNFGMDFCCFLEALGAAFMVPSDIMDPEPLNW